MLRHIRNILYLMLTLTLIVGCSDDWYLSSNDLQEELPVEFNLLWPEITPGTRGFDEGTEVKTSFKSGDVIHVVGTFNTESLQEDGSKKMSVLKRYGALEYNGRNWTAAAGNNLTWPTTATDGQFEAYYISGSNGVLTNNTPADTCLLSSLTPTTDPLKAESEESIAYGRAVKLLFSHLCAYLTLIDLEPMVSTSYWLKRDVGKTFNNAFKISLGESNDTETKGQPTLNFEFFQVPDTAFSNLVYISANNVETPTTDDSGKEKIIAKANYFLEPGLYDTFSLCYPASSEKGTVYEYLKYDYNSIPKTEGAAESTPPDLKANTTYTLTITKAPGVTITAPPPGGGWDESNDYFDVDVEAFLKAINNKSDYFYTDEEGTTQILQATANGTKLLRNVNFKFSDYTEFVDKSFRPNIDQGTVFDGDYHYIQNLGSSLFRYNYGTIQNVGIKTAKITTTSYEDDKSNDDMSRHGALCMWNRNDATINNVRVSNVEMDISVKSAIEANNEDGSETHNIGCVIGSNTGKVSEVALAGNFVLNVSGDESHPVNASVLIGGVVGQNAAQGEIYDVSPLDGTLTIKINNTCQGKIGSYSVGGVVGESSGMITGVILSNVTIDGTESEGVTSYMGGIAGQVNVSDGLASTASINSCIVSGSVTAGTTTQHGDLTSGSYIGGIAGADLGVPVVDSRTAVSVHGSKTASPNVIYATGGAFGRIRDASTYTFQNLIAYGSALDAPSGSNTTITSYTGNFAGIVPKGQTWDDNYANNNIIVRKFNNFQEIGAALDSSNKN